MGKIRRLAVIPARGGSKRIKRKNIVEFHGKPLLYWTVNAALKSALFDDVIVSTEDEEIAAIARESGASVPFLRENHADDLAPSSAVTLEVMQRLNAQGKVYDMVAQLLATCPLRGVEDIKSAVTNFDLKNVPSQISCFRFGWMNPWWAVQLSEYGEPEAMFPVALKSRSQHLPPLFCPSGAIWIAKPSALESAQSFYCPGHIFYELPWKASLDIDNEDDLQMARDLFI